MSVMSEAEYRRRLAVQIERAARGRTIKIPCGECGNWTPLPDLYRCFQCGCWLCEECGARHWPEAAAKRHHEAIAEAVLAAQQLPARPGAP